MTTLRPTGWALDTCRALLGEAAQTEDFTFKELLGKPARVVAWWSRTRTLDIESLCWQARRMGQGRFADAVWALDEAGRRGLLGELERAADAHRELVATPSDWGPATLVSCRAKKVGSQLAPFTVRARTRQPGWLVLPGRCVPALDWKHSVAEMTELFDASEEADTTLALWTPGSRDEWASFAYAREVAAAL